MYDMTLLLLYFLLFTLLSIDIYKKTKKGWTAEAFFLSLLMFFYVFVPITMIIHSNISSENYNVPDLLSPNNIQIYSYLSFLVELIFISFFYLGLKVASHKSIIIKSIKKRTVRVGNYKISVLVTIGYFLVLLSFFSMLIYVKQFGGFEKTIMTATTVRSGYLTSVVENTQLIFVKRFVYFAIFGLIVYIAMDKKKTLLDVLILLILSLATLIISRLFLFAGKEAVLGIFLMLLFYFSIKKQKPFYSYIVYFLLFLFFLLPTMDYLSDALRYEDSADMSFVSNGLMSFLGYFSFTQVSLEFAIYREYEYLFFQDFIFGLRGFILPSSWLQNWDISTIEINTFFFNGKYESTVPPGIIAFGYYSFGLFGVMLVAFLSGYIIKKIDLLFSSLVHANVHYAIFYAYILSALYAAVRTGVPKFVFYNTTNITFLIFIAFSYSFILKQKR